MSLSYMEHGTTNCPACGKEFTIEIWWIVDLKEQPDLKERIIDGTLNDFICPDCTQTVHKEFPLLIYRSNQEPNLIFSPAEGDTVEQIQKIGSALLSRLRSALGNTWQDDWLKDLPIVTRQILVEGLKRDDARGEHILPALSACIQANSLAEARQIIEAHPEVLSERADLLLQEFIINAQNAHRPNAEELFELFRTLLRRCREIGVAGAFAEQIIDTSSDQPVSGQINMDETERAIHISKEALWAAMQKGSLADWAALHNSLGLAFISRVRGDRAENIEEAIKHYILALSVYTREISPEGWALLQNNLGRAYTLRIRGDRADNLECAIAYFLGALEVLTIDTDPEWWAKTLTNLGNAYRERILGERTDNLEQAIAAYKQALEVLTSEAGAGPGDWALTMIQLGTAYADRLLGDRKDNTEQAIRCFEKALEVLTRQDRPIEWALTMMSLANCYSSRGQHSDDFERAIAAYEQSLEVLTQQARPLDWAGIHHNLGSAYQHRLGNDHERVQDLEIAFEHHIQSLSVFTRDSFPESWAKAQVELGNVYARLVQMNQRENLAQAATHYQLALEVFTQEAFPNDYRLVHRNLGNMYFAEHNWNEALAAYREAINVGDALFVVAYTEIGRRVEIGETSQLYANAAYCLLRLGRPAEALVRLEHGKTRLLDEALALSQTELEVLNDTQRQALLEAQHAVRKLDAELRIPHDTLGRHDDSWLRQSLHGARNRLNELTKTIRTENSSFMSTNLDIPDILALIPPGGALVAPLITSQGSAIFVLPHGTNAVGTEHVIMLEQFDEDALREVLYSRGLLLATEDELEWRFNFAMPSIIHVQDLAMTIDSFTGRLWETLMGPAHERLLTLGVSEGALITLLPQGDLGLLPLHAASHLINGVNQAFLDHYVVAYAPRALYASIELCNRIDTRHGARSLFR